MRVLLRTPMSPYTGYGNDGLGLARAFLAMGADVYLWPTFLQPPLPPDIAVLLTKDARGPFDLIVQHTDPMGLKTFPEEVGQGLKVGWSMWEYTNFLNMPGHTKLRKQYKYFDAMVGYDDETTEGYKPYFSGPRFTVQGGFEPQGWAEVERDWNEEHFYFCMVGMLHSRKDPFATIRAFSELKHEYPEEFEPARLSLKTQTPGLHSAMEQVYPWLRIYYEIWPTTTLRDFYHSQHVLLAPSRGEGKNIPALEFQSTGGVVLATNWGGHRQWLSPEYAYPLNYTLEAAAVKYPTTLNARVDHEHFKESILHVFRNRHEAREKGHRAAQVIPAMCSWDAAVDNLLRNLAEHVKGGEQVWAAAQVARREAST